jgi:hypothetical protein
MKKPPTLSQQLEFARLRAFVVAGYEHVLSDLPAMAETHPGAVADKMWEEGHPRALRGLREAAADVVELMQDLDDAQLAAFELRLKEAGAPSLSAMREGRVGDLFGILHRGTIRNEVEWRLTNAAVSDPTDQILDAPARELAESLLKDYEVRGRPTDDP